MSVDDSIQKILIRRFKREAKPILHFLNFRKNPNIKDNFGTTLLHMVASASLDNLSIVQYLFELGANINVQDHEHLTPLHLAVLRSNFKIAHFLISKGAVVNIQDAGGKTALHLLIYSMWLWNLHKEVEKRKECLWLVKKLLQSGADPNLPDKFGETPLMRAVRQNDFDIVEELLLNGGNVHLRNIDSDTCLDLLLYTFEPNKDILVELVKYGACVNCFGSQGCVIDFVLQNYKAEGLEIVKLLIKTATLANWKNEISFELGTNHDFHCLEEFINSCYTEVSLMKSFTYSDKSNLCHFVLNGEIATQKQKSSGRSIFDEILESLTNSNFPIYDDLIRACFDRTFLFEKLMEINMYARNKKEKKAIYLNYDIILEIELYLSDKDLFNLVIAYLNDVLLIDF